MITKVAVNKNEINRLIKQKKLKEAYEYFQHAKDMLELTVNNKLEKLIANEVILENERDAFYVMIAKEINNKFLEEKDYILIDDNYVKEENERMEHLRLLLHKKRV